MHRKLNRRRAGILVAYVALMIIAIINIFADNSGVALTFGGVAALFGSVYDLV